MIDPTLTPEQRKAEGLSFERFHSYRRGYVAGASRHIQETRYNEAAKGWRADLRNAYDKGYTDGTADNMARMRIAMERYRFTPKILR